MGAAKRTLELDYDYHFYLLGIRSDLTGYHLAYFLNRDLKIGLRRSSRDLLLEGLKGAEPTCYTYFEFEELDMERDWFLAVNRGSQLMPAFDQGLFSGQEEAYRTSFLLPGTEGFRLFVGGTRINGTRSGRAAQISGPEGERGAGEQKC